MLQRPKKGSIDFLALFQGVREGPPDANGAPTVAPAGTGVVTEGHLEGVEVGIVYAGAGAVDDFEMRIQALRLAESKRVAGHRKDVGGEAARSLAPMIFGAVDTPEGLADWKAVVSDVIRKLVLEVRGVEGGPLKSPDDVDDFLLEQLTLGERMRLAFIALGSQGPSRRQFFRSQSDRHSEAGGRPSA